MGEMAPSRCPMRLPASLAVQWLEVEAKGLGGAPSDFPDLNGRNADVASSVGERERPEEVAG